MNELDFKTVTIIWLLASALTALLIYFIDFYTYMINCRTGKKSYNEKEARLTLGIEADMIVCYCWAMALAPIVLPIMVLVYLWFMVKLLWWVFIGKFTKVDNGTSIVRLFAYILGLKEKVD